MLHKIIERLPEGDQLLLQRHGQQFAGIVQGDGRPTGGAAGVGVPIKTKTHGPVVHAMGNIEFPFADSPASVSSCMTSQCSTILPLSIRKMSTATIGFGPQPR